MAAAARRQGPDLHPDHHRVGDLRPPRRSQLRPGGDPTVIQGAVAAWEPACLVLASSPAEHICGKQGAQCTEAGRLDQWPAAALEVLHPPQLLTRFSSLL